MPRHDCFGAPPLHQFLLEFRMDDEDPSRGIASLYYLKDGQMGLIPDDQVGYELANQSRHRAAGRLVGQAMFDWKDFGDQC